MSVWTSTPTQKGLTLQNKLLSTDALEITRVVSGAGSVNIGQLSVQTAVSDIKQQLTVESLSYDESGIGLLRVLLDNYELQTGYSMQQIGIYANDPDEGEILFVIAQVTDAAEEIPSISEQPAGFTCGWAFHLAFCESSNISVTLSPTAFITSATADLRYSPLNDLCVCSTAASTAAKTVDFTDFQLTTGRHITVKFTNGNTANSPTLNINSTGAKPILYNGNAVNASMLKSGGSYEFVYDGTSYNLLGGPEEYAGKQVEGESFVMSDNTTVTAEKCAEVFNLYENTTHGAITFKKNIAVGFASHAEGGQNTASGDCSHAEGGLTTASGDCSHAEGMMNTASGYYSHAGGGLTTASGDMSFAGGNGNTAEGLLSTAMGLKNTAKAYQFVIGKYADTSSSADRGGLDSATATSGSLFVVGNGTSDSSRTNALRVSASGRCYGTSAFGSSGADYAVYYEWLDGNPQNEDRRGRFVTLDGEKIRIATAADDYILGVISATPAIVEDVQSEAWKDMYLKDVFGERITETVTVPETVDELTGKTIPEHTETRWILNPEYDPTREYLSRDERKEWAAVGIAGKLIVIDDGTCQVNGYCSVADNGIATASDKGYRVTSRIDDTHIRILINFR